MARPSVEAYRLELAERSRELRHLVEERARGLERVAEEREQELDQAHSELSLLRGELQQGSVLALRQETELRMYEKEHFELELHSQDCEVQVALVRNGAASNDARLREDIEASACEAERLRGLLRDAEAQCSDIQCAQSIAGSGEEPLDVASILSVEARAHHKNEVLQLESRVLELSGQLDAERGSQRSHRASGEQQWRVERDHLEQQLGLAEREFNTLGSSFSRLETNIEKSRGRWLAAEREAIDLVGRLAAAENAGDILSNEIRECEDACDRRQVDLEMRLRMLEQQLATDHAALDLDRRCHAEEAALAKRVAGAKAEAMEQQCMAELRLRISRTSERCRAKEQEAQRGAYDQVEAFLAEAGLRVTEEKRRVEYELQAAHREAAAVAVSRREEESDVVQVASNLRAELASSRREVAEATDECEWLQAELRSVYDVELPEIMRELRERDEDIQSAERNLRFEESRLVGDRARLCTELECARQSEMDEATTLRQLRIRSSGREAYGGSNGGSGRTQQPMVGGLLGNSGGGHEAGDGAWSSDDEGTVSIPEMPSSIKDFYATGGSDMNGCAPTTEYGPEDAAGVSGGSDGREDELQMLRARLEQYNTTIAHMREAAEEACTGACDFRAVEAKLARAENENAALRQRIKDLEVDALRLRGERARLMEWNNELRARARSAVDTDTTGEEALGAAAGGGGGGAAASAAAAAAEAEKLDALRRLVAENRALRVEIAGAASRGRTPSPQPGSVLPLALEGRTADLSPARAIPKSASDRYTGEQRRSRRHLQAQQLRAQEVAAENEERRRQLAALTRGLRVSPET